MIHIREEFVRVDGITGSKNHLVPIALAVLHARLLAHAALAAADGVADNRRALALAAGDAGAELTYSF